MYDYAYGSSVSAQLLLKTKTTAYFLYKTGGDYFITEIVDEDYPAATTRGCGFLHGHFFVMTPDAEIYQSALDDASSWDALEFIGSQIDGDAGVYLAKVQDYLCMFKTWSTEFFYDAANPTGSILQPVSNAFFKVGCAHEDSVKEMAGTVLFMGQTKDGQGRGMFMLEGTRPTKISTAQIDKILNQDDLETVYSWGANVGSHMIYGLTLVTSGITLVYDFTSKVWSYFTMLESSGTTKTITAVTTAGVATSTAHGYSDGDIVKVAATNASWNGWHIVTEVATNTFQLQLPAGDTSGTAFSGSGTSVKHNEVYFPIVASTAAAGVQYMQHATNGNLYEFAQDVHTDDIGAIAMRVRTPKFDSENAKFKYMGRLDVIGDKISSVAGLRYTDDDFVTYSRFRPVDLSVERSQLRRLGNFSRRSFEILHVQDANVRLEALDIEGV